jgi:CPA1 family monovalent cation:H+ antiporter
MDMVTTISVVAAITVVTSWISLRWLKTTTIGVPAITAVAVVVLVFGGDRLTNIRQWCADLTAVFGIPQFFASVVIPLLLFTAASCFAFNPFGKEQITSSGVAIFRGLLTALGVAGIVSYTSHGCIAWSECLLFGILVSATDFAGQARLFARSSTSHKLRGQLIGESIINSVFATSVFVAIVQFTHSGSPAAWKSTLPVFLQTGGGIILGIAVGWAGARVTDDLRDRRTTALIVGTLLFIAFLTSRYFGVAGPLEAVASGFAFRLFRHDRASREIEDSQSPEFWNAMADIENSVLFVMLGLSVAANGMTAIAITAGLAGFLATLLVRFASTRISVFQLSKRDHWKRPSALLRILAGFKGGIAIALALAIPYPATRSWILGATFIVAVLSTVVQGGMIGWVAPSGGPETGRPILLHIKHEGTR